MQVYFAAILSVTSQLNRWDRKYVVSDCFNMGTFKSKNKHSHSSGQPSGFSVNAVPTLPVCSAPPSVKQTHRPRALHKSTVQQITSRGEKFKQWCNLVATFLDPTLCCYWLGTSHPLPVGWCQETSYTATTPSKYRQSARSPDTNTHFLWAINDVWEELLLLFFRSFGGRGPLKNESHWNTSQSLILPWWSCWSTIHCALTTKHSKQTGSNSNNIKHHELSLTARDHYSVSPHLLRPHFVAQPDRIINPIHTALQLRRRPVLGTVVPVH